MSGVRRTLGILAACVVFSSGACARVPKAAPADSPARVMADEPAPARTNLFITQIAIHPARPETVFALTTYAVGLLKSTDGGRHWAFANRGIRSYSLYQLAIDPRNPDVVYVGAGGGGLYKSVDGGATFTEKNDGLGNTNIGSILLHPRDPDRLYIVTSTGVQISPDGGESWEAWNEGDDFTQSQQFQDLVILPSAPETVLLASNRGVFVRRVGDPAWMLASPELAGRPITAMALHPDGRRVFAAAFRDGKTLEGGGLYVSEDRGAHWSLWGRDATLARQWIRKIRFDPRHEGVVYLATSTAGVLSSDDDGLTWTERNEGFSERDVRTVTIDPVHPDRLYAGTYGQGLFLSIDAGRRWAALDDVPDLDAEIIIASLKVREPERPAPSVAPPPSFAKCNACHGWTDPDLNLAPHSFWLVPPNRRDWGPTVRRMGLNAKLTPEEEVEIRDFLTAYSSRGMR
ncbi:MAG: hypothetical protein HY207_08130 [Nitrospirae bacterium]|nr:hypothetical protein [Nitrospirota bacterium]